MANTPNDPKKPKPDPKRDDRRPDDSEMPDSVPFGQMPPAFHSAKDKPGSDSDIELPPLPPSGGLSDPELYLQDPRHRETDSSSDDIPTVNPRATPESGIFENLRGLPTTASSSRA